MMHQPASRPLDGAPFLKLIVSLLIDLVGYSTYIVPVAGEAADLGWGPISAYLVWYLYGNAWLAGIGLVEELLPGLDFIPTCTIAWLLENRSSTPATTGASGPSGQPAVVQATPIVQGEIVQGQTAVVEAKPI